MKYLGILLIGLWALSPRLDAQENAATCGAGDSACYERAQRQSCSPSAGATTASCKELITKLTAPASAGDRAARLELGRAYAAVALRLSTDPGEQAQFRERALSAYRDAATSNAADVNALLGIANFTPSPTERLNMLRKVVDIEPIPPYVSLLVNALVQNGSPADLTEAAQADERVYFSQTGSIRWRLAAEAIALFEKGGAPDRARDLRERARNDFGGPAKISSLSQLVGPDTEGAIATLADLCGTNVVIGLDAQWCLDALDIVIPTVAHMGKSTTSQAIADRVAGVMERVAASARYALIEADPQWRTRFLRLTDQMAASGLTSVNTLRARASFEHSPTARFEALEEAHRVNPDDPTVLWDLASEYMDQGRWDEAIEIYRQAKTFAGSDDVRRMLDHNIGVAEQARGAPRSAKPTQ